MTSMGLLWKAWKVITIQDDLLLSIKFCFSWKNNWLQALYCQLILTITSMGLNVENILTEGQLKFCPSPKPEKQKEGNLLNSYKTESIWRHLTELTIPLLTQQQQQIPWFPP